MLDLEAYLRFVLALGAVLALIAGAAWLLRRFGTERGLPRLGKDGARIKILEIKALDPRHKLVLFSRDGVEHLIALGPGGETVIESHIPTAQTREPTHKSPTQNPDISIRKQGGNR